VPRPHRQRTPAILGSKRSAGGTKFREDARCGIFPRLAHGLTFRYIAWHVTPVWGDLLSLVRGKAGRQSSEPSCSLLSAATFSNESKHGHRYRVDEASPMPQVAFRAPTWPPLDALPCEQVQFTRMLREHSTTPVSLPIEPQCLAAASRETVPYSRTDRG
jgi:hypothetical protein